MNAPALSPKHAEAGDRPGKIFAAMAAIMRKVGAVGKNGQAEGSAKYAYRKIDDVYLALQGLMAEHGVFSLGEVIEQRREERPTQRGGTLIYTILTIRHTFYAEDGSCVQDVTIGEGMDSSDKSSNKATSAAEKYSLVQAFKIPTQELRDSETEDLRPSARQAAPRPAPAPAPQAKADGELRRWRQDLARAFLDRRIPSEGRDVACKEFLDSCGVGRLDQLDPDQRRALLMQVRGGQADRYRQAGALAAV